MIIQEALAFGRNRLAHSPTPFIDARLLLEFVLNKNHPYLVAHGDEALTAVQEQTFRRLLDRAAQQEPIPYLTGQAPFFGRTFHVSPAVLIPRPETEELVEAALAWAKNRQELNIVDVGTGSGCIAVSLTLALPDTEITAIDISEAALNIARRNAARHQVEWIRFRQGDLLQPVNDRPDLVLANLPYITDEEWTALADGVKSYEPVSALRGGRNGLDFIEQLLGQAAEKLAPDGAIFLEIGWQQGSAVLELAQTCFPDKQVNLKADFAGNDRLITIT